MELLINAIVSIILYAVFGAIGISIAKGNKTLKNFCNKKNLIVLSIIYVLLIALLMRDDPENRHFVDQIFMSLGNYVATYLGAIVAVKIVTKPKKLFCREFYYSLSGTIGIGTILMFLIYGVIL
tara:strand:- start:309 stop:680 length:372 start_codon:yes stop_codon:yes gene_type:complete